MLDMFATVPPFEPPPSTTMTTPTIDGSPETEIDMEREPTTSLTALEVVPTHIVAAGIVYVGNIYSSYGSEIGLH